MYNVSQTNNAILMSRCNQLQMQLNTLKVNYKKLEEDLTKASTTLKEYSDQFTTNTLTSGTEIEFELEGNAIWNAQAIPIRSIQYETDEADSSIKLILTLSSNFSYIIQGTAEKPAETKFTNQFELTLTDPSSQTSEPTTEEPASLSLSPVDMVNNLYVGTAFTPFTDSIYLTQLRKNIYSPGVPSNKIVFSVPAKLASSTEQQETSSTTTLTATLTPDANFTVTP